MLNTSKLHQLQHRLQRKYKKYKAGSISQDEYIAQIKPIDQAIDNIEISTLQDTPVLKGSSSLLSQQQES